MRSKSHQWPPPDKATILNSFLPLVPISLCNFLYSKFNSFTLITVVIILSFIRLAAQVACKKEMAAAMATSMAILNPKCFIPNPKVTPATSRPPKLATFQNLPKGLTPSSVTAPAIAGAIFSTLSTTNPAFAAQKLAEIADGDNRGLALLLPLIPAILWVLYNILQPALNQLERMRSTKGVIVGLGLGGLAASGFFHPPEASAGEITALAEAVTDNRGQLLLFVIAPAIVWVLYNILQPALNQLNKMRSQR